MSEQICPTCRGLDPDCPWEPETKPLEREIEKRDAIIKLMGEDASAANKRLSDRIEELKARCERAETALKNIAAIEDKDFGGDWDEINEARNIANTVIKEIPK